MDRDKYRSCSAGSWHLHCSCRPKESYILNRTRTHTIHPYWSLRDRNCKPRVSCIPGNRIDHCLALLRDHNCQPLDQCTPDKIQNHKRHHSRLLPGCNCMLWGLCSPEFRKRCNRKSRCCTMHQDHSCRRSHLCSRGSSGSHTGLRRSLPD